MNTLAAIIEGQSPAIHLVGFLMVVTTLAILWFLTASVGLYFKKKDQATQAKAEAAELLAPKPKAVSSAKEEDNVSDEELALLSACVMSLLGSQSRIVSIRSSNVDWGHEGRRAIHASHRIR